MAFKFNSVAVTNFTAFAQFDVAIDPDPTFDNRRFCHAAGIAETQYLQEIAEFDIFGVF